MGLAFPRSTDPDAKSVEPMKSRRVIRASVPSALFLVLVNCELGIWRRLRAVDYNDMKYDIWNLLASVDFVVFQVSV